MGINGSLQFIETSDDYSSFTEYKTQGTPERNLLMAILERAILDYVGNDRKEHEDAKEWIFGISDKNERFSFEWICSELDLDAKSISSVIAAMPRRGNRKIAPWYFREEWN